MTGHLMGEIQLVHTAIPLELFCIILIYSQKQLEKIVFFLNDNKQNFLFWWKVLKFEKLKNLNQK